MIIKIENYTKIIKNKEILSDVNYTFHGGNIYGLYGRNGSGKTMLLRAISGLIFPTSGSITIDGEILHKDIDFPRDIGLIIENTNLLPQYTGFQNLKILSKIRKVATDEDINNSLEKLGLSQHKDKKVKEYSLGMKQKLSIAQSIFEKPKILLLDEPTNALDNKSIEDVRNLLLEVKNSGVIVIIASHNNEDLNILCDKVLNVIDGKIN